MRYLMVAAAVIGVSGTGVARAAADDFEIQASLNAPAHPVGQKMPKGTRLVLPDGATVSLIDRTTGRPVIRECSGRYDGPVETCTATRGGGSTGSPGGTRGGGTRGAVR